MRNPSLFWSSNALQLVLKLFQAILTARLAGPANMGVYVAAVAIPLILVRVVEIGLSQSLSYFTRFDKNFFSHAVRILFLHVSATVGPVLLCVFLMRYFSFGDAQVNELVRLCLILITGSVVAQLFTGIISPLLVAMDQARTYAFVSLAPPIFFMSLMLALHVADIRVTPYILVVCDVFANGMTAIFAAALVWKWRHSGAVSTIRRAEVYTFALQAYPGILSKVIVMRLDRIVLAALLPPSALALYSVGVSLRDVALSPSSIFSITYQTHLVDQVRQGLSYRRPILRAIVAWSSVFALGILVFWFVAPVLIPLVYGEAFAAAVPITRIMIISTLFLSVATYCWMAMTALRRPTLISITNIIGGAVSIALLWVMAKAYGVEGAAWSTVISTALLAVFAAVTAMFIKPAVGAVSPDETANGKAATHGKHSRRQ